MNTMTKLVVVASVAAALGSNSALADSTNLRQLIDSQRQHADDSKKPAIVTTYTKRAPAPVAKHTETPGECHTTAGGKAMVCFRR